MAGPDHIPAAEYARRAGLVKSRMSAHIAKGLPYVDGQDAHGRLCKLVVPQQADDWIAANVDVRLDPLGRLSGLRSGTLPEPDRLPPAEEGDPRPAAPPTPARPVNAAAPPPTSGATANNLADTQARIAEARASEFEDKAAHARLRRLKEEGSLLDRKAAISAQQAFVTKVGTAIDRMAADSASVMAAELGVTDHQAFSALKRIAVRMREDLARDASSNAAGARAARAAG